MSGGRPLGYGSIAGTLRKDRRDISALQRRPNLPESWVYVGDPFGYQPNAPAWQNSFDSVVGNEIAFRHGLDGELDMIGMYDLTLGSVTGTVAFTLPKPYREDVAPAVSTFAIQLDVLVWSLAVQTIDVVSGDVTIYWPIVADPMP